MGPGQKNRERKAKRKKQKQGGRSSGKNKLTIERDIKVYYKTTTNGAKR